MPQILRLSQQHFTELYQRLEGSEISKRIKNQSQEVFEGDLQFVECAPGIIAWYLVGKMLEDIEIQMKMQEGISLQFIQSAKGTRKISHQKSQLFSSGILFASYFNNEEHQIRKFNKGTIVRYVGIWVTKELVIENFLGEETQSMKNLNQFLCNNLRTALDIKNVLSPAIQHCMDDLLHPSYSGNFKTIFQRGKIDELILFGLTTLEKALDPSSNRGRIKDRTAVQSAKVQRAAAILKQNLETPPSASELAKQVSMGRNLLCRLFHDKFGCTIHQYSKRYRMVHAAHLIKIEEHTMVEVALMTGFTNQSSFSRAYKDHFGIAPSNSVKLTNSL